MRNARRLLRSRKMILPSGITASPIYEASAAQGLVFGQAASAVKLTTGDALLADAGAYWRFNDSGSPWQDATTNNIDLATSDGTPTQNTSVKKFQTASLDFDSGDGINKVIATGVLSPGNNDFTVAGWVRPEADQGGLLMRGYFNETADMSWGCRRSGQRFYFYISRNGSGRQEVNSSLTHSNNSWHFYCAWYDDSLNKIYLSINNATAAEQNVTDGAIYDSGGATTLFFRDYFNSYLVGQIEGWGYWERILTATERTYLYQNAL